MNANLTLDSKVSVESVYNRSKNLKQFNEYRSTYISFNKIANYKTIVQREARAYCVLVLRKQILTTPNSRARFQNLHLSEYESQKCKRVGLSAPWSFNHTRLISRHQYSSHYLEY